MVKPTDPCWHLHRLKNTKKGGHQEDSFTIWVTLRLRAVYVEDPASNTRIWYWIGTHEDYNNFVGLK